MLKLPLLQRNIQVTDRNLPAQAFQQWWQQIALALVTVINDQADQIAEIQEVLGLTKRNSSYTSPTAVLNATDAGATASIQVINHTRIYGDATEVSITGAILTGLVHDTTYVVYYDDTTLAATAPTFHASTTIEDGYNGAADGRHTLGVITTPAIGGAAIPGGGAYAPGVTIGGEI